MTGLVRRAAAFAAIGTVALPAPLFGRFAAAPFLVVAILAVFVIDDGPLFELFARPGDREGGSLFGLAGFALAAAGLALLASLPVFDMPSAAFVATVILVSYGNLGETIVRTRRQEEILATVGFGLGGAFAAGIAVTIGSVSGFLNTVSPASTVFLLSAGTLLAGLLRSVLFPRDDPLVLASVGLLLWFLGTLASPPGLQWVTIALLITLVVGWASYALETASIPGMLTGVFLGLLTLVLGGVAWFVVLIAFFGIGGLSTKYRYEEKAKRGVAEENEGARGSGNVLGNAAVSLLALLGFTAAPTIDLPGVLFVVLFAGALAAAMADTLSSEIGGVYDDPRLITTFETVPPGTDGAITIQGIVAGAVGAVVIGAISDGLFATIGGTGAIAIIIGGFVGMNVDSLLGATLEGKLFGNQMVNFLATLAGALTAAGIAVSLEGILIG